MSEVRVEITLEGRSVLWLGVPPEGLILGGDADADVRLPDLAENQSWRLAYADGRLECSLLSDGRNRKGTTRSLCAGDRDQLGPYELTPTFPTVSRREPTRQLVYRRDSDSLDIHSFFLRIETPTGDASSVTPLNEGRTVLGKDPACDIVLSDAYVSARHAAITAALGRVMVADLGSRNGMEMDGRKTVEAEWREGQTLCVGRTRITLVGTKTAEKLAPPTSPIPGFLGECQEVRRICALVNRVAPTDVTALIEGETGAGKEVVARGLHTLSARASGPFIPVNCGAIPRELFESELFGHVRGAFTGATSDRRGLFSLASGGTLFLDEVGELPPEAQVRLLRVLEDRRIRPVGGGREIYCDVRVIAATNRNLEKLTKENLFRKDLYFRLRMVPITLPPLRSRGADIELLARHFLAAESKALGRSDIGLTDAALARIKSYSWPGNVRELKAAVIRALVMTHGRPIDSDDLLLESAPDHAPRTLEEIEADAVRHALNQEKTRGAAAKRLGIAPSTLYEKIKKHGIA